MKFIDTHCHLNLAEFENDREAVIKNSLERGIFPINAGVNYQSSKAAAEIAENHDGVWAAIGLHPGNIKDPAKVDPADALPENIRETGFNFQLYEELAQSKKVVAAGEIGLDYFYKPKTEKKFQEMKVRQIEVFKNQLDFARAMKLPVMLHCRAAHGDLIKILKNDFTKNGKIDGVVHCFTGGLAELREYLELGLRIGLDGIIFKMDLDEAIKNIPPARLLLETDCPYLTPPRVSEASLAAGGPPPLTGRNEPRNIKIIAQRVAQIRRQPLESIAAISTQNAQELFGIEIM